MATTTYTTSLTVNFTTGSGDDNILTAILDDREDGLNAGNNNFTPGVDNPAILIFHSPDVVIDDKITSVGNLSFNSSGEYAVEEYMEFAKEKSKNFSKPVSGGFTYKWIGAEGPDVSHNGNSISLTEDTVGVLKVSYTSTYQAYNLNNIPAVVNDETEFPVVVFIAGHAD